jgi:hypothetical protein
MKTFTIETETNNITIHTCPEDAKAVPDSEQFATLEELAGLASGWPTSRLIEIWNGIPGVTPVNKFKDRKTAVARIWNAIRILDTDIVIEDDAAPESEPAAIGELEAQPGQETESLTRESEANVGEQAPDFASEEEEATKKATRKEKAPTGERAVKAPREASKTSRVIEMLKRQGGVTIEEIMTEMGWLKHTTRAMLSAGGSLTKNHALVVTSGLSLRHR